MNLSKIKENLKIVDVVEFYTAQKVNQQNKMLCPFHDEKTASFAIYPDTNSYYCFGCESGGDVIRFLEKFRQVEFKEAIQILTDDFGVDVALDDKKLKQQQKIREKKQKLEKIYHVAVDYFKSQLTQEHIEFISNKYGLTQETIAKAKIGYSGAHGGTLEHLRDKGFSDEIYKSGLVTKTNGQLKDMFYNRIMIPYLKDGQVEYFTGRSLKSDDDLKYLNLKHTSPEVKNPLFYVRLKGADTLLLTEGEFDALAAAELTDHDVIGLGKAGLSKHKKKDLFKLAQRYEEIIISNDTDKNEAGKKGAIQTARAILEGTGVICRVAQLEGIEGLDSVDIADYNRENKELMSVIEEATEFIELLISEIAKIKNGRKGIKQAKELYPILSLIEEDFRGYYADLIREAISEIKGCSKNTLKKSSILKGIEEVGKGQASSKNNSRDWFEYNNGSIKFRPALLGQYFLEKNNYITLSDNIYQYLDGVYQDEGEDILNKKMQKENILGEEWESHRADSTLDYIKRATKENPKELIEDETYSNLINVKNGMLDLNNLELIEHDPKYKSLNQLNVKYDKSITKHEEVEKAISSILLNSKDPDPAKIKVFWEYVGSIICMKELGLKKALLLVGDGNNGKTVLLNFLTEILDKDNIASVGLYDLTKNDFAGANLFGKLANLAGEMTNSVIDDLELFKKLTGNDLISADQKYKQRLKFRNRAKMIFALNTLPTIKSYEKAFFNRLLILRTPNTFSKEKGNYDPQILEKITTPEAKSYALNKAIEGLIRLIGNDLEFTQSQSVKKEVKEYKARANKVIAFINETCNLEDGEVTSKAQLYEMYKVWAKDNGYGQLGRNKFSRRVAKHFELDSKSARVNGKVSKVFKGLQVKNKKADYYSNFQ